MDRKVAIITGAGSGIGKAIAQRFAAQDVEVVCVDLNRDRLDRACQEIEAAGGAVRPVLADVSTAAGCAAVLAHSSDGGERIFALVNNAGITRAGNVIDLTEDEWDLVQRVNLKSVFLMCKNFVPLLAARGGGAIINIASGAGLNGVRYRVAYAASKAGVINLTRCLALDHAGEGIRANVICPGVIDTEAMRKSFGPDGPPPQVASIHPLGRIGTVAEVAAAAWFLASDEAAFITGVSLPVDGGASAGKVDLPTGRRR